MRSLGKARYSRLIIHAASALHHDNYCPACVHAVACDGGRLYRNGEGSFVPCRRGTALRPADASASPPRCCAGTDICFVRRRRRRQVSNGLLHARASEQWRGGFCKISSSSPGSGPTRFPVCFDHIHHRRLFFAHGPRPSPGLTNRGLKFSEN